MGSANTDQNKDSSCSQALPLVTLTLTLFKKKQKLY